MKRLIPLILALAPLAAPAGLVSYRSTVAEVLSACRATSPQGKDDMAYCIGVLHGLAGGYILGAVRVYALTDQPPAPPFCLPARESNGILVSALEVSLSRGKIKGTDEIAFALQMALADLYPCPPAVSGK